MRMLLLVRRSISASTSGERMATYVPEEVVVNILSRLPPKSLIRFKCVSKSWHALIGNPDFLYKNVLNHSILTQNPNDPLRSILFFAKDLYDNEKQVNSFRSYDSLHCASQTPLILPQVPNFDIVGCCNGLLCLWDFVRRGVCLWDPAASSELKFLPSASSSYRTRGRVFSGHVGFGFDSGSNDFKVVKLFRVLNEDGIRWAEIYSLRCGSWRVLDLCEPNYVSSQTAALDGVFLWYAHHKHEERVSKYEDIMVAFDFSDEKFRTMLFPDACFFRDYGGYRRIVTELKGSVAMLVSPVDDRKKTMSFDIWVMLEFGVRESWTRLLIIELPLHLKRPLGFWKNGELFIENSERQLVLYDILSQTETNLQFEGFRKSPTMKVVDYRLSSVLINGGKDNP